MANSETQTISWELQRNFARVSGDYNPVHMDDVAARRTQAGRALVHGMHLALWALDRLIAQGACSAPLAGFKAKFSKMVFVGETVSLRIVRESAAALSAQVLVGNVAAAAVTVNKGILAEPPHSYEVSPGSADQGVAAELSLAQMTGLSGVVPFATGAEEMFPNAAGALGATRVRAIGAVSRLIGMVCPGLHSIASSYEITFTQGGEQQTRLDFKVTDVDERFRLLTEHVQGGGIQGAAVAVARVPPVAQPHIATLAEHVDATEFAGVKALVIGGSRGLGELAAKIIAAGGGSVTITYVVGKNEAQAVCEEIRSFGAQADVMQYDIREDAATQLQKLENQPTHVLYFATGVIASRNEGVFSARLFEEFCRFYVAGFYNLCQALVTCGNRNLAALYPSSVFVTERPAGFIEYAMAKAAGELLCEELMRAQPGVRIKTTRLPRMLTDQTATATPLEMADASEILIPLLRDLRH